MGENIVITIARQYGSGGKTIGAMLAKELGINCYSREILKMASEESGINEGLFGMSDEKIKKAPWFKILNRPYDGELLTPEDRDFVSDDNLFNYQAKIIRELAQRESCVIIGRCSNYILKDYPNVLRVFIHADWNFRMEKAAEKLSMSQKEIEKFLQKDDKRKDEYYRRFTGEEWKDATQYDLCLDSSKLGYEKCIEEIENQLKLLK
mgnify:CR=1 FL=1